VLVLVGLAMFQTVGGLDLALIEDSLPAFITIVLIPLTLSITQGILWGFVLHALLYTLNGRAREVSMVLWMLAALSAVLLVVGR
jgi:AGZA family xanthine/uracil permease-like MFS transporter